MNNHTWTWTYYLPEDSGIYYWQEHPEMLPILVNWNAFDCIAEGVNDREQYYPKGGRWCQPTHPDPHSPWDRPQSSQLEITNSTHRPIQVRVIEGISDLQSDYLDNHPEMLEDLEDLEGMKDLEELEGLKHKEKEDA